MDNNEILQITGTIEDIIYRNNDNGYSVVDVDVKKELITATGVMSLVKLLNLANTILVILATV